MLKLLCLLVPLVAVTMAGRAAPGAEIVEVRKIWDRGAHNAFTDLIHWRGQWWCTFREAEAHVGGDGAIRVLVSRDGETWESAALLTEKDVDLRDPKFSVTPAGRLMLNLGGSVYLGTKVLKGRQSRVAFSDDGRRWSQPQRILAEGDWLWRVTWHDGVAYGAAYRSTPTDATTPAEWLLTLHRSRDGVAWEKIRTLDVAGRPNETTLRFTADGEMIALVRREAGDTMGYVGRARPPYAEWTWQTSNHRFGGQNFIQLPNGTWLAGTRDYTNLKAGNSSGAKTMLAALESDGSLTTLATFPSGGDTSYPGMVWREGVLWLSYYSSHEDRKSAIYLARVKVR